MLDWKRFDEEWPDDSEEVLLYEPSSVTVLIGKVIIERYSDTARMHIHTESVLPDDYKPTHWVLITAPLRY